MKLPTFFVICVLYIFTLSLSQVESVSIHGNQKPGQEARENVVVVSRRLGREDEDAEEGEDGERKQPALYPLLFNLFGAVVGANETHVNKTVDRIIDRYNSIDPDSTTTPLPPPSAVSITTNGAPAAAAAVTSEVKGGGGGGSESSEVEEEDEDEEKESRRARRRNYVVY